MKLAEALREYGKVKRKDWASGLYYILNDFDLEYFCDGEEFPVKTTILELEADDWVAFKEQSSSAEERIKKIKEILGCKDEV